MPDVACVSGCIKLVDVGEINDRRVTGRVW